MVCAGRSEYAHRATMFLDAVQRMRRAAVAEIGMIAATTQLWSRAARSVISMSIAPSPSRSVSGDRDCCRATLSRAASRQIQRSDDRDQQQRACCQQCSHDVRQLR